MCEPKRLLLQFCHYVHLKDTDEIIVIKTIKETEDGELYIEFTEDEAKELDITDVEEIN